METFKNFLFWSAALGFAVVVIAGPALFTSLFAPLPALALAAAAAVGVANNA